MAEANWKLKTAIYSLQLEMLLSRGGGRGDPRTFQRHDRKTMKFFIHIIQEGRCLQEVRCMCNACSTCTQVFPCVHHNDLHVVFFPPTKAHNKH